MASAIQRLPAVIARTGLSRSSIYKMIKEKQFPSPVLLGERAVGWFESDIDSWLESRVQASNLAIQNCQKGQS